MNVHRLGCVQGLNGLTNDVLSTIKICHSKMTNTPVTLYFGGDVQDYPEVMSFHRDHGRYLQWNILNMISLMSIKFPLTEVLVVKPNRMEIKTFACYDNFVDCNKLGAPTHQQTIRAMDHLQKLVKNSLSSLYNDSLTCDQESKSKLDCDLVKNIDVGSINLVGFSKGCVVLNQLITEAHILATEPTEEKYKDLREFWSKVRSIYWLDGGHSGGKNTWITSRPILNSLASFPNIKIRVHATPYQVKDYNRPWIGKECKSFVDILKRTKADVEYKLHFEDEETTSIETHFNLLEEFIP